MALAHPAPPSRSDFARCTTRPTRSTGASTPTAHDSLGPTSSGDAPVPQPPILPTRSRFACRVSFCPHCHTRLFAASDPPSALSPVASPHRRPSPRCLLLLRLVQPHPSPSLFRLLRPAPTSTPRPPSAAPRRRRRVRRLRYAAAGGQWSCWPAPSRRSLPHHPRWPRHPDRPRSRTASWRCSWRPSPRAWPGLVTSRAFPTPASRRVPRVYC